MDLFLAFSEGGTEFYLNQSDHPFPTVFWKKVERDDSQLGTCFLVPMHSHQIAFQREAFTKAQNLDVLALQCGSQYMHFSTWC